MRNVVRSPRVLGGLALLLAFACSSSAVPRAEAEAQLRPEHEGDPDGGTYLAGAQLTSKELCAPEVESTSHEENFAQLGRIDRSSGGGGRGANPFPDDQPPDSQPRDSQHWDHEPAGQLCHDQWIPPPFQDEQPAVDVDTDVVPGAALKQTARVTNTGNTLLVGIVAGIDVGSCVHGIGPLEPGDSTAVFCSGTPPENGRAAAEVLGRSPLGSVVSAEDEVGIAPPPAPPPPPLPPHPEVELALGAPAPGNGTRSSAVPVRITNPSAVALRQVDITGFPPGCGRSFDRIDAGRSVGYDCPALPGDTVDLTVSARAEGGFLPEGAVVTAGTRALVPPAPPPPSGSTPPPPEGPQPAPAPPPEPPAPPRKDPSESAQGPLSSPAQTAGVISVAAVLVMMVSVGALSSATRSGK